MELENPDRIVLFGSYASGAPTEDSDVDLLVVGPSPLPRRQREVRLTRLLFGSGIAYDLLALTPQEVQQRLQGHAPFLRQILSSGKVLYERT